MSCTITQQKLDQFKLIHPEDERLQSLSLQELIDNTDGGVADWSKLPKREAVTTVTEATSCPVAMGFVIYDCVALFLGAGGTRDGVTEAEAEAVAEAAEPVLSQLEKYIETITKEGASVTDQAQAVWGIISTIYNGGCIGGVISAFLGTLTWYNWILYSATALATIIAAVATDGAAEIAEIIIELATAGWLISDSVTAAKACNY